MSCNNVLPPQAKESIIILIHGIVFDRYYSRLEIQSYRNFPSSVFDRDFDMLGQDHLIYHVI